MGDCHTIFKDQRIVTQLIKGFSKLSREEKINQLIKHFGLPADFPTRLERYRIGEEQALFDDFSENTLTNFFLPFGVAPNFRIDGKSYVVPMVTEESSVVAAASRSASFWAGHGGFKTTVHDTQKVGQIWFRWKGPTLLLSSLPEGLEPHLTQAVASLTLNMEKRGGGITRMQLLPSRGLPGIYQLQVNFNTVDSMGANFINSCLEEMKEPLLEFFAKDPRRSPFGQPEIIMAILSNHTPECLVTCSVECPIDELTPMAGNFSALEFAQRFKTAVDIALDDTSRAVTHNKGLLNGTDAVVLATGNDFRAVEAGVHAFAARDGRYRSLSRCTLTPENHFLFELAIPLAMGTVGGLTTLHPMAALALELLGKPSAKELMSIAAAAGMANNFSAVTSLITTGIQKGHMKLHLTNLLNALEASETEKTNALNYFQGKAISANAVRTFLNESRNAPHPGPPSR